MRNGKVITLYLAGLGPKEKVHIDIFRRATALIVKRAKKDKVQSLFVYAGENLDEKTTQAITEGAILGDYRFDKYKTQKEEEKVEISKVEIYKGDERGIRIGQILANAQRFVRDLVNEPGNVINPITLAEIAQKLAQEHGLECKVYDEKQIQEMGMLALWSVGRALQHRLGSYTLPISQRASQRIGWSLWARV